MAFLRVFVSWELMLEETFVRLMCGYDSVLCTPRPASGVQRFSRLADARQALYSGQTYLLWHNPGKVEGRSRRWLTDGVHEQVFQSNHTRLEWFANIRHRIAHGSDDARTKMHDASMQLAGRRYRGASAGRFLRDWRKPSPMTQERWLITLVGELTNLARQIAP